MEYFVDKGSIVRKIWGKGDTVLYVFAGASAEFALNKAVDWLYFTGSLPSDPIGRLFSTVMYARKIVFSELHEALSAIDQITGIHAAVENKRKSTIPDWAYRDVLYMLIYYSIASFELLERKITDLEKEDLFDVFLRMGTRMKIKDLPVNYTAWQISREEQLKQDLVKSLYTTDLYKQYKKHLGPVRYLLLLESQKLLCPPLVCRLLGLGNTVWIRPLLTTYLFSRKIKLDRFLKSILLPKQYKEQIAALDAESM